MLTIMIKEGTKLLEMGVLHFQVPKYIIAQQDSVTYKIQIELNLLVEHNKMPKWKYLNG